MTHTEAQEIVCVLPVHESCWKRLDVHQETLVNAITAMRRMGDVVSPLELKVQLPEEINGLKLPIVLEDGTELPNDLVLFRYSAMAVPHDKENN